MASQRAQIKHLTKALQESNSDLARARGLAQQAFERQILIACLLEKVSPGGVVLPLALRQQALDESWGYETMIVQDEPEAPMVVRLLKGARDTSP